MKLEIANGPKALEQIHGALEAFWRKHEQVPQNIRNDIDIAAGEIAANILEHARAVTVWMELVVRLDAVEIEFTDAGEPVDLDLEAATMPAATIALMKFMGWSPSCERSAECARSRSRRSI